MPLDKVIELKEDMSLAGDIVVFDSSVANKISVTGYYHTTLELFICRVFKTTDNFDQGIGLGNDAVRRILCLFPRLEAIRERYLKR